MSKRVVGQNNSIAAVIGDQDTVTGFLLTGIGEKNLKQETNYFVVNHETKEDDIQKAFKRFLSQKNIAVILVTQQIAEKYLRTLITNHDSIIPTILEIPSKDAPYDPRKDAIIINANRQLYGTDV
ncbi:hypothetical protein PPERSA_02834 [Pseudocohnilembus persalinus]|uniref:V-type proton ATPase subunit F n=1 Tax=Pseudocohnilembus persalinus TaxID=266149 RepID=A0A0V0QM98_PSEPJ|nr:hypothetical protein PPERSA_02834 [Pseudocohnilembus persalinus]|eukprot:KRX03455.1 hypothetical protein PPERSA_02834 [Pseudocohnilembus persalinus]